MAPATLKEPETPRVPGILKSDAQDSDPIAFSTRGRAALSLLKPTPSVSEPGPPSLSHQHRSDWTPQEDHMLIRAHAQGYSWWRINEEVFPTKSPIAVNQRYQRLQRMLEAKEKTPETREAKERPPSVGSTDHLSSWNKPKFQRLAREYMKQRKQIWSSFAAHVGADWEDVEDACMSTHGLQTIRSIALIPAHYDHLLSQTRVSKRSIGSAMSTPSSHFDGDSGIFSMSSRTSYWMGSASTRREGPLKSPAPSYESDWDDDESCPSPEPDNDPSSWSSAHTESDAEALEAERTPSEPYDPHGQVAPTGSRNVTARTAWEGTNYFQVEIGPHTVSRREDNDMINATKLFNVADVPRGRRDGILKSEKVRQVVTEGPTHLKGVWIPYERALVFANTYQLTRVVHPLFAYNINAYQRKRQLLRVPVPSVTQEATPTVSGALKSENFLSMLSMARMPSEPEKSADSGYCGGPVQPDSPSSLESLSDLTDQCSLPTAPPSLEQAQRAQIPEPETTDSKADMLSATSESGLSNSSSSEEEEPLALSKDGQKSLLLNRLMKYFYEIFSACPTHRGSVRTHTSGGRQRTSDSGSFRSGLSSASPSNQPLGGGRKRSADDEPGDGDDQGGRAPKRPRGSDPLDESKEEPAKRLACPYFKMDPSRHHTARSCLGPGWATVHRIKEHLYRCHSRPISCPRCHETFENDRAKDEHMAAEVRCEIVTRDGARHEGFDSTQKELLRSRKKAHKQMTEIEKWYDVYMILFPGADPTSLPSPYYEYVNADSTDGSSSASELSRYEQFLRRELPTRVRQQLEIRIEEELEPVEEHLRAQLVEIVRDMQLQLFDLYKASRTDKPQADAQGPSEPQEQPEPEKPEPHEGDADPSSFHEGGVVEPAQQSFHAPALPPVPSWNPTIDEQLEAFRPEPPYTGDYFDDFNGLLFDFHPSLLTASNSPGDSGYMSIPSFADYMQPKAQSHPQPGAGPEHPPFDGRRN